MATLFGWAAANIRRRAADIRQHMRARHSSAIAKSPDRIYDAVEPTQCPKIRWIRLNTSLEANHFQSRKTIQKQ
jgi:hypothetical protein